MGSRVDLHTHSTASDGCVSPSGLVEAAERAGLAAVALTDHDTLAGCGEFLAAAEGREVDAIPGVELSCEVPGHTCHMLGYFLSEDCSPLSETLEDLRRHRESRNARIIEKLHGLGVEISLGEVRELAKGGVSGRLHLAQCLVQKEVVNSTQKAFDRYLARGKPAYVERKRLTPEEACQQIRSSGGLPVLAHPAQMRLQPDELWSFAKGLVEYGLCGMEVFYPNGKSSRVAEELRIAQDLGLEVTAGSDYHGAVKPQVALGGTGCSWMQQSVMVDRLRAKLAPVQREKRIK